MTLIEKHSQKLGEQDKVIYRHMKSDNPKEKKQLEKQYQELREEIYSIEDEIAQTDEGKLDEIVEPNPEDIVKAYEYHTHDEWKQIGEEC